MSDLKRLGGVILSLVIGACATEDEPADLGADVVDDGKADAGGCSSGATLSETALSLWAMDSAQLEALWASSSAPDPDVLRDHIYLGINEGKLLDWMAAAGIGFQRFAKVYYDDKQGQLSGHNFMVPQGGDEGGPYCLIRTGDAPTYKMQGYFAVTLASDNRTWNHHDDAVLLDYGARRHLNGLDPAGLLRDYVVQPFESSDILLGRAYLALPFQPTVGYFVLQRATSLSALYERGWVPPQ